MSMNVSRALEVLHGLQRDALAATAEEIEEVLALNLAVEADPDDLAALAWLRTLLVEETKTGLLEPEARNALTARIAELDEKLKSDWYRITTSKEELARTEARRVNLRRALGVLADPQRMARLEKIVRDTAVLAPEARYVMARALGSEVYALTHKGHRLFEQLGARVGRCARSKLADFVRSFDKAEAKMSAFSNEIATLSAHIGHVRKNREQVVIGLAKAGGPVMDTVSAYKRALDQTHGPDVAVVCTRNASALGGVDEAARRLKQAERALGRAGFPQTPLVLGCAKSLLGFAPEPGITRFKDLHRLVAQVFGHDESVFKHTARLMPAAGMPAEIIVRVKTAASLLSRVPVGVPHAQNVPKVAVALASMVRTTEAIPELVTRFRQIETALVQASLTDYGNVEADALECVACPGTPTEVVATVKALLGQLAAGRSATRSDVAVAMSFAKRFAY